MSTARKEALPFDLNKRPEENLAKDFGTARRRTYAPAKRKSTEFMTDRHYQRLNDGRSLKPYRLPRQREKASSVHRCAAGCIGGTCKKAGGEWARKAARIDCSEELKKGCPFRPHSASSFRPWSQAHDPTPGQPKHTLASTCLLSLLPQLQDQAVFQQRQQLGSGGERHDWTHFRATLQELQGLIALGRHPSMTTVTQ